MTSSGTITMPPPTPKIAERRPAATPMPTRRRVLGPGATRGGYERARPMLSRVELPPPLARLRAEPALAALLLDVDGTLAPIVDRPEDAAVPAETRAELTRLRDRYGLVACISGRSGDDARRIVGVGDLRYVGSHGLE